MTTKKPKKKSETTAVETPIKRKREATAAPPADFDPVADAPPLAPPPMVPAKRKASSLSANDEKVLEAMGKRRQSLQEVAAHTGLPLPTVTECCEALNAAGKIEKRFDPSGSPAHQVWTPVK